MSASPTPEPAASTPSDPPVPTTLRVATVAVAVQALVAVGLAVSELGFGAFEGSGTAVAVAVFLGAYGVGLGWAARLLHRGRLSARSPLVLAQLLHLGIAWNMRSAPLTAYAVALAALAVLTLAALLARPSTRFLLAGEEDPEDGARA
ncbi:hypothetical protein RDV89_11540 [Nocardioides zeae]|uniref:Integral membrane protein n=1 Tax=Nocardioides imazamoxiresistens TaxID=3231893 RepID=A0ABU3PWX8_9ACTN|nr:hypothetical protein [Nocardioides zeae]MDT9593704.1 hypothetical protein [Nocardioides zeae]